MKDTFSSTGYLYTSAQPITVAWLLSRLVSRIISHLRVSSRLVSSPLGASHLVLFRLALDQATILLIVSILIVSTTCQPASQPTRQWFEP